MRDRAIGGDPAAAEVLLKYGPNVVRGLPGPGGTLVAVLRARLNVADGAAADQVAPPTPAGGLSIRGAAVPP